jgi:hypothetical protein
MKLVIIISVLFFTIWSVFNAFLLGYIPIEFIPEKINSFKSPQSIASLGDSASILDSFFSSFALILGLIAVLMQGRELKASTAAQTEQAVALTEQIKQQQESNRVGAYTARLQFLLSGADRIDLKITQLVVEVETISDLQKKAEKWDLIKNLRNKELKYRDEAMGINETIKSQLDEV